MLSPQSTMDIKLHYIFMKVVWLCYHHVHRVWVMWHSCSHRKKRMKQLQKKLKSGSLEVKDDDPFELFIAATDIRYCYYSETHKILGNTYGMCVLQVRILSSLLGGAFPPLHDVNRILKHLLLTCLQEQWRQWRVVAWL